MCLRCLLFADFFVRSLIDIAKVRLQTRGPGAPTSMVGTFAHVAKNDGILGLYSGVCSAELQKKLELSLIA